MRKILSLILLVLILVLSFSSCSFGKVKIDDYTWTLRTAMYIQEEELVVCASEAPSSTHPQASIVEVVLTASDGKITITDSTNQKSYEGTYKVTNKTPAGTDYEVVIDGKSGYATCAMTTYANGNEEPTLPINLDGYSLYFYAE